MEESKTKPKILILLAACNRVDLIGETMESILRQSYPNWECIIVDDNSVDNTGALVQEYCKKDNRFSYFLKAKEYKNGLPGTRNYALDLAQNRSAEYIQFFDDDDLMHPLKLEMQVESLQKNRSLDFVICGRRNFENINELKYDEEQNYFKSSELSIEEAFLVGDLRFGVQAPLFCREYIKGHFFDEELSYAEDWLYFSKLFYRSKAKFSIINKVLFYRRKHAASMTETGIRDYKKRSAEIIAVNEIFSYITKKKLHTRVSLFYFFKKFLLYQYDSNKVETIGEILQEDPKTSLPDKLRYKLAVNIHKIYRKSVLFILDA